MLKLVQGNKGRILRDMVANTNMISNKLIKCGLWEYIYAIIKRKQS